MTEVFQLIVYGIVLGSILSLGAIGVSLIYSILRFAHFAHGDLMTLGAYFALAGVAGMKLPMFAVFVPALIATAFAAIAIDWLLYRYLRKSSSIILLISTLGTALMLRSLIQIFWGPDNSIYKAGISFPFEFAGLHIKPDQLVIVLGTIVIVTALHLFLHRTRIGKAMRAMADNMDLAKITGINTEKIILWTWIIAALLAAAAGIFLGMDTRLNPGMGWHLLLPVFAACILGGIGSFWGAVIGGYLIGIAQELSTIFISPGYKPAVAFTIIVIMLILRPKGIIAGKD